MRLDKYLKVSRLVKRRTVANELCDAKHVTVNGKVARASYDVKPGDVITYKITYKNFPMGHGEKSLTLLLCSGLALNDDEMLAIRWHMGAWDLAFQSYEAKSNINEAGNRYPLLSLIQSADNMATHILEL